MLQPYPLAVGETLDFVFDASDLAADGDSVSTYALAPSSSILVSDETSSTTAVAYYAAWNGAVPVGTSGTVTCTIHSTFGRILLKEMTFFAADPTT